MRVAVIEDEIKLANSLKEGLEGEGYQVSAFYDGESALAGLSASAYDLVLLDLMLPKKSGAEVCRALRKEGSTMPIMVVTAHDSTEEKVKLFDLGADDFIAKPFAFEELLARMRALSRRSLTGATLTLADVVLDTETYRVTRAGALIPLTLKEFELLRYLMERHGRAASRDEVYEALWGREDRDFGNVVDVHVRNLRKKIDDDYDKKIIRTVRGVGYAVEG